MVLGRINWMLVHKQIQEYAQNNILSYIIASDVPPRQKWRGVFHTVESNSMLVMPSLLPSSVPL